MVFLIDKINERERAKYEENTIKVLNNVVKPITAREYLVPNNAKSSAVYFWQNVLLIPPAPDGHTFPLTFIPSDNQNIIVKARFSHHPSGPLKNWTKHEAMGNPNKRVDIYFFGADDSDDQNGDMETHIISNKHLYNDSDVKILQQALATFFKSGNFVNPFCENNEDNITQQLNCNTYMNKKLIRLTESDLHKVIKESVNKVLTELDWKTYAHAAKKAREQGRDSKWDFDRATERALDKQYGGHHLVGTENETYQDFHTYNDNPFSTHYDRAWRPLEGHEDFGSYADVHDSKKAYGNEDIADFVHGRSKYVKGKGWQ